MSFAPQVHYPPTRTTIHAIKAVSEELRPSTDNRDKEDLYSKLNYMYYPESEIFTAESYDLVAGAGLINERMADLLSRIAVGAPFPQDDKIEERARRIAASLPEKRKENINDWAHRLAKDIVNLTD